MDETRVIEIVHNPVTDDSTEDEKEVLSAAEEVANAITELGYKFIIRPFDPSPDKIFDILKKDNPLCVFNLVEAAYGSCRMSHIPPAFLEHWGFAYTGSSAEAIMITTNKVLTKRLLALHGLATAEWLTPGHAPELNLPFPARYIIKPIYEDASVGLDSEAVITVDDSEDLERKILVRQALLNKPCFAERFIEGREFNISILAGPDGPEVLPPAEMHFFYEKGQLKIMDYKAKWVEDTPEYDQTKRSFNLEGDESLVEKLRTITRKCWDIFELKGYARVDFRVDKKGKPWLLEINANPCLQPESGLAAAGTEAGLSFSKLIGRIIADALPGL